jgi:hypothetical protein
MLRHYLTIGIFGLLAAVCLTLAPAPARPVSEHATEQKKAAPGPECQGLKEWYLAFNDEYFGGALPKNALVEYGDARGAIAYTTKDEGRFHVVLEKKFTLAPNVAHSVLLHESCHILSWSEFDEHGHRWHDCMDRLYQKGAFEGLL